MSLSEAQDRTKQAQDGPKMRPGGAKMSPGRHKMDARWLPEGRLWEAYVSKIVALRRKTTALASRWGQLSVQHDRATRVFKKC